MFWAFKKKEKMLQDCLGAVDLQANLASQKFGFESTGDISRSTFREALRQRWSWFLTTPWLHAQA
jgi:hypothetical protein